jgi:hypothetical protein
MSLLYSSMVRTTGDILALNSSSTSISISLTISKTDSSLVLTIKRTSISELSPYLPVDFEPNSLISVKFILMFPRFAGH